MSSSMPPGRAGNRTSSPPFVNFQLAGEHAGIDKLAWLDTPSDQVPVRDASWGKLKGLSRQGNSMKRTQLLLTALGLGALATTAFATTAAAQGVVNLSWDTCTGPINRQILPGTQARLVASVIGHGQPHLAYQVFVSLGSGSNLRDAWRFDAAGCQGSSFITIEHLVVAAQAKACPSFQGSLASIQIKDYSYDPATGRARAVMANTYPGGNHTQVNPAQRYFLAGFLFDHLYSVNGPTTPGADCGGLEVPVCALLSRYSWLTLDGQEIPWAAGQEYVTSNDPNMLSCFTPAVRTTWGLIKHQYTR